jgi:branched-chain amino acid transport system substrate-binding protein
MALPSQSRSVASWGVLLVGALLLVACSSNNNNKKVASPVGGNSAVPAGSATQAGTARPSVATAAPAASAAGSPAAASGPPKEAKFGVALSLTGGGAQYGETQRNGVNLAVAEINAGAMPGVKLTLVIDDDASSPDQVQNVYQKFVTQDKVNAIIGPTLSNQAQVADPYAQQNKVPVLGVSNTAAGITDIGDYIFRDSLTEADVVPQTIQKSQAKLGYKTVAVMYANDDAFSKSGYDAFKAALDKNNIKIVDTETFSTNDKEFSAQLTKVKDAKPDAIVVSALLDPAVGIVTQARKLGLTQPVIGGNGFNSPAFIKGAGDAAEGVIVGAAWNSASSNPTSQKFIAAYRAKYNSDPDQFAAQAYTGVYIMAKAIVNANSIDRTAIRDGLTKIKDFDTVLGTFNFTDKRDAQHPAVIQVVQSGKFVPLQ